LRYFIARLIQVFAPGIPQVYYVGLLAGKNDLELLEKTKEGRNINRHYYTKEEVAEEVKRPVVAKLLNLLRFRNQAAAFDLEGSIAVETPSEHELVIVRRNKDGKHEAKLTLNVKDLTYSVENDGQAVEF
jgi:sucrose phosphorylase